MKKKIQVRLLFSLFPVTIKPKKRGKSFAELESAPLALYAGAIQLGLNIEFGETNGNYKGSEVKFGEFSLFLFAQTGHFFNP